MNDRERLVIYPDGLFHTCGVKYAGKRVLVREQSNGLLLVKEMPGKAWTNRMSPWHSTPARLPVYQIVEESKRRKSVDAREPRRSDGSRREIMAERIIDIELREIAKVKPKKPGA